MSNFHPILSLQEIHDQGAEQWLSTFDVSADHLPRGRYPTRNELEGIPEKFDDYFFAYKSFEDELEAYIQGKLPSNKEEWAVLSVVGVGSGRPATRMSYRGHSTPVGLVLQQLEILCGGPFIVVLDGETPVLAHTLLEGPSPSSFASDQ